MRLNWQSSVAAVAALSSALAFTIVVAPVATAEEPMPDPTAMFLKDWGVVSSVGSKIFDHALRQAGYKSEEVTFREDVRERLGRIEGLVLGLYGKLEELNTQVRVQALAVNTRMHISQVSNAARLYAHIAEADPESSESREILTNVFRDANQGMTGLLNYQTYGFSAYQSVFLAAALADDASVGLGHSRRTRCRALNDAKVYFEQALSASNSESFPNQCAAWLANDKSILADFEKDWRSGSIGTAQMYGYRCKVSTGGGGGKGGDGPRLIETDCPVPGWLIVEFEGTLESGPRPKLFALPTIPPNATRNDLLPNPGERRVSGFDPWRWENIHAGVRLFPRPGNISFGRDHRPLARLHAIEAQVLIRHEAYRPVHEKALFSCAAEKEAKAILERISAQSASLRCR